jgi:hypothetical protein
LFAFTRSIAIIGYERSTQSKAGHEFEGEPPDFRLGCSSICFGELSPSFIPLTAFGTTTVYEIVVFLGNADGKAVDIDVSELEP